MADPILSVRGLRYAFPDGTVALDGVDFDLLAGESVALLGANGSGKTTFVLHLNGLLLSAGAITISGIPLSDRTLREVRRKVGLVFQDADDQLFMPTVVEDVEFGPLNLGVPQQEARARAEAALRQVGLNAAWNRPPYHLSAGEKRRAAIAGVLAMNPDVLVLDEPTTYLDPPGRRELIATLESLTQTRIVVTHDVQFAEAVATRAVFFDKGRIVASGPVRDVARRFSWE